MKRNFTVLKMMFLVVLMMFSLTDANAQSYKLDFPITFQMLETFEKIPEVTDFSDGTFTGSFKNKYADNGGPLDNGIEWTYHYARSVNSEDIINSAVDLPAIMLGSAEFNSSLIASNLTTPNNYYYAGIQNVKMTLYKGMDTEGTRQVELFINGKSYGLSAAFDDDEAHYFQVNNIAIEDDAELKIVSVGEAPVIIDDINISNPYDYFTVSAASLDGLEYDEEKNGPSESKSLQIKCGGVYDAELYLDENSPFELSLTNTPEDFKNYIYFENAPADITVYIRLKKNLPVGNYHDTFYVSTLDDSHVFWPVSISGKVKKTVSLKEVINETPKVFTTNLQLIIENAAADSTIEVYNTLGQKIAEKSAVEGRNQIALTEKGLLIVRVGKYTTKVVMK